MTLNDVVGITGLLLGIPSTALAVSDWQRRRQPTIQPTAPATATATMPGVRPTRHVATLTAPPETAVRTAIGPLSIPRRILSTLIDGYGFGFLIMFAATILSGDATAETEQFDLALVFSMLVAGAGLTHWHTSSGRSLGKLVVGGRLQRHSDPSLQVSPGRAFIRLALALIPLGFWLVLGPQRRTAHDRLTDTEVVRI